ncbi:serine/threonine-protein kinase [Gordonia hankookensis]|uniref:non-specific serine/threonine protein kinase n=1 Tax=Gordonia hankookensis TaxID=589403 RepID=A0ABR7WHC8_9ACTN|nr:serine/threonine-protein kinase [Gordonia hankookensis]MBD1321134.1 serine/threonine protein kinase [Gordonia hankookensis]
MSGVGQLGGQVGPYRLDDLLGHGGMGEVYRAYDTTKHRVVALKLLNPVLAEDPKYQQRFRRESHAAAGLGDPHVIPIHDWGDIDGLLYIDMRLVDGESLRTILQRGGALQPERAVSIVSQVASALDDAHRNGVVHRDIKPENILLTGDDFVYLVDFGIAHGDADSRLTDSGMTVGSVAYMAPELFDSDDVSPATDIYALACVLFECLTGRVPHPATTISAAIKAAVLDKPPSPSMVNPTVPMAFDAVVAHGLRNRPDHRYSTARALADDARRALSDDSGSTANAVGGRQGDARTTAILGSPAVDPPTSPQYVSEAQGVGGPPSQYAGQGPPTQYPPPYGYGPSRDERGSRRSVVPVLVGIIAAALIGLLALGGYWLLEKQSDASSDEPIARTTPTVTQTVTPQEPGTSAMPTVAAPPQAASSCGAGVAVGTSVTSCPFAVAVRDEYLRTGPKGYARDIVAYSPVTGTAYQMSCAPEGAVVACRGGNDAVVYVY